MPSGSVSSRSWAGFAVWPVLWPKVVASTSPLAKPGARASMTRATSM